jgi:hypothetical protein
LRAVYISVVGAVITIIPLFLITFLFRNSRAKKTIDKTSKNDSDNNDVVEYNSPDIRLVETGKLPHWVIYIAWKSGMIVMTAPTTEIYTALNDKRKAPRRTVSAVTVSSSSGWKNIALVIMANPCSGCLGVFPITVQHAVGDGDF